MLLKKASIERVVLLFILIASLWVLVADLALPYFMANTRLDDFLKVYRGIGFVAFSGILIYILLLVESRNLRAGEPLERRSSIPIPDALDSPLECWMETLALRSHESAEHCQRVADLTVELAQQFGISEEEQGHIHRGAWLHDIGKVVIPDSILLKNGPLSEDERAVMQQHPQVALRLLQGITSLAPSLDIPYCHHERWDGGGYPRGLKGEEIPLSARIFAVVEVWDAMTSDRPFRKALPGRAAITYIRCQAGTQFDSQVVDKFLQLEEIAAVRYAAEEPA